MQEHKNIFFTSDLHLGHDNIIKYCDRPFETTHEMNETLIRNWNSVVPPLTGEVYVIGDMIMGKLKENIKILKRLNGRKYFISGNHDKKAIKDAEFKSQFEWIKPYYELKISDHDAEHSKQMIVLCHYAFRVWNKSHHGSWNLYGHSHGTLPDDPESLSWDVGVDNNNYTPMSYDEVKRIMKRKKHKPIDHHGAR